MLDIYVNAEVGNGHALSYYKSGYTVLYFFGSDMEFDRYKFVVQCIIGEQRGQDVKMSCRCFWDSDTDNYAQDVFMNVSST